MTRQEMDANLPGDPSKLLVSRAAACIPPAVAAQVLASGITGIGEKATPKPPALPAKE